MTKTLLGSLYLFPNCKKLNLHIRSVVRYFLWHFGDDDSKVEILLDILFWICNMLVKLSIGISESFIL